MNNENRLFCKGFLGSFLIDLEISKIYQIITSSKPPQRLTAQAVDNLIVKCIVDSHQFIKYFLVNGENNLMKLL
jgi:hypothetical protein